MSKIQEFIDAWNTAVDVEIATAQSEIDAYLAARQTAIALTDPFILKMPTLEVFNIDPEGVTTPGFDVTTIGQLFEWSFPAEGMKAYDKYGNFRSKPDVVEDYVDKKYAKDSGESTNPITPTTLYIQGYTFATMSYLAKQYETGLRTHQDLYNILKVKDSGFVKLAAEKKLKNLGGKAWFDSWMHSLYRVIYNTKISVSNLKYKDYSDIFMRIEDELDENYLKGFYNSGTRFPLGIGEQSKYFQAVLEAGDNFFTSQTSGTQSGTQSGVNTDYTLSVINPLSDIEKKISGKITFIEAGKYIIPNSTLNGLPNPWTNPKTKVVVPNNTGIIKFSGGKSTSSKNSLATDAILALQNIIEGTYGLTIYLKYTEPDGPPVVPPSDSSTGPSASAITGASESSVPGPTSSTVGTQEFTFNVEQLDIFSNADFGNLFIIGQEDETLLYDDGTDIDDEYKESEFEGDPEASVSEEQEYTDPVTGEVSEEIRQETEKQSETINSAPYVPGKYTLDMIPGTFYGNNKMAITCCQIDGKPVSVKIADAVLDLKAAAKNDGIKVNVNSGFRPDYYPNVSTKSKAGVSVSAQSQEELYKQNCKSGSCSPKTAKPGNSKHGSGIAIDFNTGSRTGKIKSPLDPKLYSWMVKNSFRFGFVRTVASEEWHFEYWGTSITTTPYAKLDKSNELFYVDLGLNNLVVGKASTPDTKSTPTNTNGSKETSTTKKLDTLPSGIKKAIAKLEKEFNVKIDDSHINAELSQEGGYYADNGGENAEARKAVDKLVNKIHELFPKTKGLGVISAHRTYDYQITLFGNKIAKQGGVANRQKMSAIPGFSQHHTGKAFDIFSVEGSWWDNNSDVKKWVYDNVGSYGFKGSYFKKGPLRSIEPWHLYYIK